MTDETVGWELSVTSASISSREFSDLVAAIYDCTLDPSRWDQALTLLGNALGCPSAQLFLMDLTQNRLLLQKVVGSAPSWIERQDKYLPEINERVGRWLDGGLSMDEPLILSRVASPELLAASPYFQEYVRPQKHADVAQINIMRSATRLSGLGFGRHESVGFFSDREVDLLRLFVPHVRRAVAICNAFGVQAIESGRLADALDALQQGVIVVREDGYIIHANLTAEAMMQDEGPLASNSGVLQARDASASAQIRAALRIAGRKEVGKGQTGPAVRLNCSGGSPMLVHVLPLAGSGLRSQLDSSALAAVIVQRTVEDTVTAKTIASAFGLTPAETRTLTQILEGKTVPEAAEQLGVSPTTARTHLDSIFAKTGVSRQSHLVRLATRMAAGSA